MPDTEKITINMSVVDLGKIDLLVSNPPYISSSVFKELPREIRDYEPEEALVGGETGLEAYERILSKIKDILAPGACMVLETDPITGDGLISLAKQYLEVKSICMKKDYNKKERILIVHV